MKTIAKRAAALLCVVMILSSMLVVPASAHSHDSSYWNEGRCKSCGEFLPVRDYIDNFMPIYYKVADGKTAYMRVFPYMASSEYIGQLLYTLRAGTQVVVTETVINGFGNAWHHVWYNGAEGYIVADKLAPDEGSKGPEQTVFISNDATAPKGALTQGRSFGLYGVISSQYPITNVTAYVYSESASLTSAGPYKPLVYQLADTFSEKKSYNIRKDGLDDHMRFGTLAKGDYVYVVTAMTSSSPYPWPLIKSSFTIK